MGSGKTLEFWEPKMGNFLLLHMSFIIEGYNKDTFCLLQNILITKYPLDTIVMFGFRTRISLDKIWDLEQNISRLVFSMVCIQICKILVRSCAK